MRLVSRLHSRLLGSLLVFALTATAQAQSGGRSSQAETGQARDGQRDFDWEIGTWKTHLRRLAQPLSGATEWIEYTGTSVVSKVLGGKANLVELDAQGSGGRIEGMNLRLYNPATRQWSLYYASARRDDHATRNRILRERPRRVLRPRDVRWQAGLRAIRDLGDRSRFRRVRAGVLGGRRKDLGGELDRRRYEGALGSE